MEGAVLQGVGTFVLGSARPEGGVRPVATDISSYWFPFRSRYGISGHAYHGAFPWMALAEALPAQAKVAKPLLYAFSGLPGLSRLQTDSHYPSQIFLGWALSYATTTHTPTKIASTPYTQSIKP
jgi:membrane-associated phospholipid phosphatase